MPAETPDSGRMYKNANELLSCVEKGFEGCKQDGPSEVAGNGEIFSDERINSVGLLGTLCEICRSCVIHCNELVIWADWPLWLGCCRKAGYMDW